MKQERLGRSPTRFSGLPSNFSDRVERTGRFADRGDRRNQESASWGRSERDFEFQIDPFAVNLDPDIAKIPDERTMVQVLRGDCGE